MDDARPSHAGGVVYRLKQGRAEYVLIRPKSGANEWLLPKGHIEAGETEKEGALREVREETGVIARVICSLSDVKFSVREKSVHCRFFLMALESEGNAHEGREHTWFPYEEALQVATHTQTRGLLEKAERARVASPMVS
jgi:ADP-ribose pyrophosphatase YjhB (NUDIX family)